METTEDLDAVLMSLSDKDVKTGGEREKRRRNSSLYGLPPHNTYNLLFILQFGFELLVDCIKENMGVTKVYKKKKTVKGEGGDLKLQITDADIHRLRILSLS